MKVLFVATLHMGNSYIDDYFEALQRKCDATCSVDDFWRKDARYDVIHLHWPEALTGWVSPDQDTLNKLAAQLQHWKDAGARLVITRHNIVPHGENFKLGEELYTLVYSCCDYVLHFAKYSVKEFLKRYSNQPFLDKVQHVVIPHGNYISQVTYTKAESRKTLSIRPDAFVITAFGHIRNANEKELILQAYKRLKIDKKFLVVPRWESKSRPSIKRKPLARLWWEWQKVYNKSGYFGHKLGDRRVSDEELVHYINATDILMIPRTSQILNSGNLYLGFSYGKVVVGPASGNVGEILKATGNPTFNSEDLSTVVDAIEKGAELSGGSLPQANYLYAANQCSWDYISNLTLDVYRSSLITLPNSYTNR
ncbi:hypothetical protein [Mucilaginibacter lacusdianchii]|uniref:hypothetical protein n=1 Tax=Mucilaginibacter lacusdianchii TaxID=2684211 RepID=UPI00131A62B8|nr:hypothetical protein [Mucilaginibacter sp. JXJ CY 39]